LIDFYTVSIIAIGGLGAGIVAGIFGIGGGTIIVPLLVSLGFSPTQAVGTSSITIFCAASSGTWHNWRAGNLEGKAILGLGIPAIFCAQVGVWLAQTIPPRFLIWGFAGYLVVNAYMVQLRAGLTKLAVDQPQDQPPDQPMPRTKRGVWQEFMIGAIAGVLSGLFGVGGGVVLVPLQVILLESPIKPAIRYSLGAVMIIGIAGCLGHSIGGNVRWLEGLALAGLSVAGAQIGTRILVYLREQFVSLALTAYLLALAVYMLYQGIVIVS
jgi:Predicted permeases